jgi:mannose-6-phosphate isomerase-like protein (cupin superfamily)
MPIVNTGNAAHYVWGEVREGWRLLDRADLSVIQERIPPGRGEVRHYHDRARQLFFVLEGALAIEIEGDVHHVAGRDSLEVPPTSRHRVWNAGTVDAAFLVVSAPTTQGDRVNVAD